MNRNGRGRVVVRRSEGGKRTELRGERERREAVTIYVKRRGKETDEKNDDGSPPAPVPSSLLCGGGVQRGSTMATSFTATSN